MDFGRDFSVLGGYLKATYQMNKDANFLWIFIIKKKKKKISSVLAINLSRSEKILDLLKLVFDFPMEASSC